MYEDQTVDVILNRLLANIGDQYEKTPGNLAYDLCRSVAIEENILYQILDKIIDMVNVDNLTGEQLEQYVYQRKGLTRKPGGYSSTALDVQGNTTINTGDLFSISSNIQFSATESATINGTGQIHVQCTQIGAIGNVPANSITQMPVTIAGIVSVTNVSIVNNGYDEESDDNLRNRYYQALQEPATSGNRDHYKEWAEQYVGVGKAMIFSLWNGDNTVKVIIIDSNKQLPAQNLVDAVQEYIDPKGTQDSNGNWSTWGMGYGQAPIGAYCTVASPTAKTIDISVSISKDSNYTDDEVKQNITDYITGYLQSIALDEINNYVSYAKIGNLILNANGVLDYNSLIINGGNSNIPLNLTNANCEIPVLGAVTITDV
ncbi:baseplate J/gp47 family protein [Clostridium sp. Mt-5]|uniref:Baseplate J/gp47 family protein n=1 Tax=Clostridium moutaii TaxID=3240932 RepID=A0ABV4BSZ6_9CLOT